MYVEASARRSFAQLKPLGLFTRLFRLSNEVPCCRTPGSGASLLYLNCFTQPETKLAGNLVGQSIAKIKDVMHRLLESAAEELHGIHGVGQTNRGTKPVT